MNTTYNARQVLLIIVIAVVVAGSAGYFLGYKKIGRDVILKSSDESGNPSEQSALTSTVSLSGTSQISVDDQVAGDTVKVASVTIDKSSWIAIREDQNGAPRSILGAQHVANGTSKDVTVDLLRPTVKGTYYAVVYTDDGDGVFDYKRDAPLMENDHLVMVKFNVN